MAMLDGVASIRDLELEHQRTFIRVDFNVPIKEGRINVKPIITATLPIGRAVEAFELAADRRSQMKVQLTF